MLAKQDPPKQPLPPSTSANPTLEIEFGDCPSINASAPQLKNSVSVFVTVRVTRVPAGLRIRFWPNDHSSDTPFPPKAELQRKIETKSRVLRINAVAVLVV